MKKDRVCKIFIEKTEDDYHYLIEDSSQGIASFRDRMIIPRPSRDRVLKKLKSLGATIEWAKSATEATITNRGSGINKNEFIKEDIEKIGGLIFKYMIPHSCKDCLSNMDSEYVVISTDDVEIPWELMHDGTDFYCLKYSIGRKIQARVRFKSVKRQKTDIINVLFIANPTEDLPDAEKEVDKIIANLNGGKKKMNFHYLKGENATIDSLFELLEAEKFDIFHFAGHAGFNKKHPEMSVIKLYDDAITAKYLLNVFEDSPPRLAFINACESAASEEIEYLEYEGKLTGMATAFISAGVDAYIGTLWPVHDEIASELSTDFYNRIIRGESIGSALKNAKINIFRGYRDFSNTWASFVLYGDPHMLLLKSEEEEKIQEPIKIELEERSFSLKDSFALKTEFLKNQVQEVFNNIRRAFIETKTSLKNEINLKVVAHGVPILIEKKKEIRKAVVLKNFTLEVSGERKSVAEFLKQLVKIHVFWYSGYPEVTDPVKHFLKCCDDQIPKDWWKVPGFIESIEDIVKRKEN